MTLLRNYKVRQCFWWYTSCEMYFHRFVAQTFITRMDGFDLIVYVNFQGKRQPDKVYLAILAFWTFVPANPLSADDMFVTYVFDSIMFGTFILHLNLCWKRGGSRTRKSRTILWVSEWVDVCVLDHFLIVMRCHVQVINADMFII